MSILFILVVVGLGGFIFVRRHRMNLLEQQKNIIDRYLYRLRHFMAFKQYISIDGSSGIAIDESRKAICLVNNKNGIVKGKIIVYKDIVSSKIVEDGQNIDLHLVTRDKEQPNFIVNFINPQVKQDSSLYKVVIEKARDWNSLMSAIIDQAIEDEKVSKRNLNEISARSIAH